MSILALLAAYITLSFIAFFIWVNPSIEGTTDQRIAADSTTYIYIADSIRDGSANPYMLAALATFPNTLWVPVLLALVLKSTLAMAIVDYLLFFASLLLLRKSFVFSTGIFLGLLLINPTTMISLISVNKEIVDMLAISLFLYARHSRRWGVLILALMLALINRYEVCAVMLLSVFAESRLNPFRRRRVITVVLVTLALDVALPLFASNMLSARFEEASHGGVIAVLDTLEMHYLYVVAVVPKILENLFGELVNPSAWKSYASSDLANSYMLLFNNFSSLVVVVILAKKRLLTIQSEIIYLCVLGASLMAVSLVIQPRYFYFIYVLFCLQAAHPRAKSALRVPILNRRPVEVANV